MPSLKQINLDDLSPDMNPSILDLKISWRYFKAYWKTFIGFVLTGYAIAIIAEMIIIFIALSFLEKLHPDDFMIIFQKAVPLSIILSIPVQILIYAYFGSIYGLAYDLFSSGDEYTRFSGSFNYFIRYGGQYVVLQAFTNLPSILLAPTIFWNENTGEFGAGFNYIHQNYAIFFILLGVSYIWYASTNISIASVTVHGHIKLALKENYAILRKDYKRVYRTFGLLFLIFNLPTYLILLLQNYLIDYENLSVAGIIYSLLFSIAIIVLGTIAAPVIALVTTRIYNTNIKNLSNNKEPYNEETGNSGNDISINRIF